MLDDRAEKIDRMLSKARPWLLNRWLDGPMDDERVLTLTFTQDNLRQDTHDESVLALNVGLHDRHEVLKAERGPQMDTSTPNDHPLLNFMLADDAERRRMAERRWGPKEITKVSPEPDWIPGTQGTCSYCGEPATWAGTGTDGTPCGVFSCDDHKPGEDMSPPFQILGLKEPETNRTYTFAEARQRGF